MHSATGRTINVDEAQEIATNALIHISQDPDLVGRFLAVSGIGPESIRHAAEEPGFLAGVLEFLMGDEALLLTFCENHGVRPTMIAASRFALVGHPDDYA
ncbi:DUF3572 domain-containing protein [Roseibium sp.]|uniref:DUF3572 domain-containing protein n=1 Tax=Roseibium sp. TaxID=1936156 RepID=UPI003A980E55